MEYIIIDLINIFIIDQESQNQKNDKMIATINWCIHKFESFWYLRQRNSKIDKIVRQLN